MRSWPGGGGDRPDRLRTPLTALEEPILAGETYIVSAGEYGKNLGSITLSWNEAGEKTSTDYRLIPIDGTWESDPEIAVLIEGGRGR